jgi:hypothetical protein
MTGDSRDSTTSRSQSSPHIERAGLAAAREQAADSFIATGRRRDQDFYSCVSEGTAAAAPFEKL